MLGNFFKNLQKKGEFNKVMKELDPNGPNSRLYYIYGFYSNSHTTASPIGVKPIWIDTILQLFFDSNYTNAFRKDFEGRCIENGLFCVDLVPTIRNLNFSIEEFNKYFNNYGKELQKKKMYNNEFMTNQIQNYYYNPRQYEESVKLSEAGWAIKNKSRKLR
jgi:hypothetical protein